ncbi:MAG: ABC transporter permease [Vicinamibacteria bacterium]
MVNAGQDLKLVLRRLRQSPGQSLLIVATLGVVLGANTLVFSFVNGILLDPLPQVANKTRLVNVHRWRNDKDGVQGFSYPAFHGLSEAPVFESGLVGFNGRGLSLERNGTPELVFGMLVSQNYFEALGVRPRLGRTFVQEDDRTGAAGVVVLSDAIWRARFGAETNIVGSVVRLIGHAFTVIGIGPPRFSGHFVGFAADLWIPISWAPSVSGQSDLLESRSTEWIEAFGRLKPQAKAGAGATLTRLLAEMPSEELSQKTPERILVEPLTGIDRDLRMPVTAFLALLQGATLLVACIALVNVSSLLLARSIDRGRETAVRLALGASPRHLLAPFATEALFLCAGGAFVGLAVSFAGARLVPAWLPPFAIPLRFDLSLDTTTFAFSLLVAVLGTAMATLGPGLAVARSRPSLALGEGGAQRTARSKWRSVLVVSQVTFATVVLANGSAFARYLAHAGASSPGFDIDTVQMTRVDASVLGLQGVAASNLQRQAFEAVAALPGVLKAGFARTAPYSLGTLSVDVRDTSLRADQTGVKADWNAVSTGFFETLGLGVTRGRSFSDFDTAAAPSVVVISEQLAARLFGNGEAVGRSIALGAGKDVATVVGVVTDASLHRLGEAPRPSLYRPFEQAPSVRVSIFARSPNPGSLSAVIRPALAKALPGLPVLESLPLREFATFSQTGVRLGSAAGLALGILGLGLAAVGLFGLVAHTVASRVREIAIRMAMGATSAQILSLILREGGHLGLVGLGLGLLGALAASPLIGSVAPNLSMMDPLAFLEAALVVVSVVTLATLGPAWRASRVAPADALRAS